MSNVDPYVVRFPEKWMADPEVSPWARYTNLFLHDLWLRTGGAVDKVASANEQFVYKVSVSAGDSPYTQVNAYESIELDATDGDVTVNLLPTSTDNFCRVERVDNSSNTGYVYSADGISDVGNTITLDPYDSVECNGGTARYYL